jgi:hypothetical protein
VKFDVGIVLMIVAAVAIVAVLAFTVPHIVPMFGTRQ